MKQMTLIEMDGFLKGKCIPRDLKVNETNAEYLVRKFAELESKLETALREFRSAGITIDNLEAKCAALAVENAWLNKFIVQSCYVFDGEQGELVQDERAAFNAWNNDENLPIAGVGAKNAAWLAWQARAVLCGNSVLKVPPERPADSSSCDDVEAWFDEGWNACRAAMLQSFGNSEQLNSPVIPDGWKLVPIDPTKDMLRAGQSVVGFWLNTVHCYSKMLAAAPAAPQQEADNG